MGCIGGSLDRGQRGSDLSFSVKFGGVVHLCGYNGSAMRRVDEAPSSGMADCEPSLSGTSAAGFQSKSDHYAQSDLSTPAPKRALLIRHSITSSARASSEGGTLRPSVLAVFRLITSSNFAGCSIGS